jgi:hypothetical protein
MRALGFAIPTYFASNKLEYLFFNLLGGNPVLLSATITLGEARVESSLK